MRMSNRKKSVSKILNGRIRSSIVYHLLQKRTIILMIIAVISILISLLTSVSQVMAEPARQTSPEPTREATIEPTAEITPEPPKVTTAEPGVENTPEPAQPAQQTPQYIEEEPIEAATAELSQYIWVQPLAQVEAAGNPAGGTTNNGQTLSIIIDTPPDGEKVLVPPGHLNSITGRAVIGNLSTTTNILYVVDLSGSTSSPSGQDCDGNGVAGDVGDNLNGDTTVGDTLDCEISGLIALNNSLANIALDVGFTPFGSGAAIADVDPTAGQQNFTSPVKADKNSNGWPDIEEVARSFDQGRVNVFTPKYVGGGTDFDDALISMNSAFSSQPPGERNVAFFLTDGAGAVTSGSGSPLDEAANAGTLINTFAIGSRTSGACTTGQHLAIIADTTAGSCTEVSDPSQLQAALGGITPADIDRVELLLNNGRPMSTTLDALGNWSVITSPLTGIKVGPNVISATVYATDATSVTAATVLTAGITVWGVDIIARDDTRTIEQDSPPITIEILTNDATSTGTLTITTFTRPGHGTISVTNSAGGSAFIYTPAPGFSGEDTFTYTISNGLSLDTATVKIIVNPRPPASPPQQHGSSQSRQGGGATIPEPTTITLVSLGLGSLAAYARRRRANRKT